MFIRLRKKKKPLDEKVITERIHEELKGYITLEDVKEYLSKIRKDEEKRKKWNSLTPRKKLKLLRFVAKKKGEEREEKESKKRKSK